MLAQNIAGVKNKVLTAVASQGRPHPSSYLVLQRTFPLRVIHEVEGWISEVWALETWRQDHESAT